MGLFFMRSWSIVVLNNLGKSVSSAIAIMFTTDSHGCQDSRRPDSHDQRVGIGIIRRAVVARSQRVVRCSIRCAVAIYQLVASAYDMLLLLYEPTTYSLRPSPMLSKLEIYNTSPANLWNGLAVSFVWLFFEM